MRILVAVDNSPQTNSVLQFCTQFSRFTNETLTILTVIERESDRQKAAWLLACCHTLLPIADVSIETKIRLGYPAEEIICEAEENDCDLVVLGEGKHRALATRFFLGSTSIRVSERAPCSVIVVKGAGTPVRKILLCDSGAKESLLNRLFPSGMVEIFSGEEEITVLHVMSQIGAWPGVSGSNLRASAEELIKAGTIEGKFLVRDLKTLEDPWRKPKLKVRHGLVVDEVLAETIKGDYDLVVIGAHKSEGWLRFLLDDLAKKILIRSERSVLVIR